MAHVVIWQAEQLVRRGDTIAIDQAAILSPDGTRVAFVRGGDLYVSTVEGGEVEQLTHDANPLAFNGLPEFVASEELDRFEGMWWSARE